MKAVTEMVFSGRRGPYRQASPPPARAPGDTTKTITIEVKGDSKKEADETFYLDLFGNSSNSSFTTYRGIVETAWNWRQSRPKGYRDK